MSQKIHYISEQGYAEQLIKNSKFMAWVLPIKSKEDAQQELQRLKSAHPKAAHHCSGYTFGLADQRQSYSSDDGEPSGTAGKPILNALKSSNLSNALAIVVRYYGGTKLGTSGLIKAYRETTALAVESTRIKTKDLERRYRIAFDYGQMATLLSTIKRMKLDILHKDFNESPSLVIAVPLEEERTIAAQIIAALGQVYLSEISAEKVDQCIDLWSQGYM